MAKGRLSSDATRRLRSLLGAYLGLLGLQFFVGMVVNAFVVLPQAHPGAGASQYFAGLIQGIAWAAAFGPYALQLHVLLGVLLFVGGLWLIAAALRAHRFVWHTVVSWVGIIGAAFNGGSFLNYGDAVGTFLMATGFALSVILVALAWVECRIRRGSSVTVDPG